MSSTTTTATMSATTPTTPSTTTTTTADVDARLLGKRGRVDLEHRIDSCLSATEEDEEVGTIILLQHHQDDNDSEEDDKNDCAAAVVETTTTSLALLAATAALCPTVNNNGATAAVIQSDNKDESSSNCSCSEAADNVTLLLSRPTAVTQQPIVPAQPLQLEAKKKKKARCDDVAVDVVGVDHTVQQSHHYCSEHQQPQHARQPSRSLVEPPFPRSVAPMTEPTISTKWIGGGKEPHHHHPHTNNHNHHVTVMDASPTDALLTRLPTTTTTERWRMGPYSRAIMSAPSNDKNNILQYRKKRRRGQPKSSSSSSSSLQKHPANDPALQKHTTASTAKTATTTIATSIAAVVNRQNHSSSSTLSASSSRKIMDTTKKTASAETTTTNDSDSSISTTTTKQQHSRADAPQPPHYRVAATWPLLPAGELQRLLQVRRQQQQQQQQPSETTTPVVVVPKLIPTTEVSGVSGVQTETTAAAIVQTGMTAEQRGSQTTKKPLVSHPHGSSSTSERLIEAPTTICTTTTRATTEQQQQQQMDSSTSSSYPNNRTASITTNAPIVDLHRVSTATMNRTARHGKVTHAMGHQLQLDPQCQPQQLQRTSSSSSWTPEEDAMIVEFVKSCGNRTICPWHQLAQLLPGRQGQHCRNRWMHHLNPAIVKGNWTLVEDHTILTTIATVGYKWTRMAQLMKGRTDNSIKNHWHSSMKPKVTSYLAFLTGLSISQIQHVQANFSPNDGRWNLYNDLDGCLWAVRGLPPSNTIEATITTTIGRNPHVNEPPEPSTVANHICYEPSNRSYWLAIQTYAKLWRRQQQQKQQPFRYPAACNYNQASNVSQQPLPTTWMTPPFHRQHHYAPTYPPSRPYSPPQTIGHDVDPVGRAEKTHPPPLPVVHNPHHHSCHYRSNIIPQSQHNHAVVLHNKPYSQIIRGKMNHASLLSMLPPPPTRP